MRRLTSFLFLATVFCCTFEKVHWNLAGSVGIADVLAILFLLAFAVFGPGQVHRIRGLRDSMGIQSQILGDLHDLTGTPAFARGCRPVAVPNHRPVPHIALWAGIPPAAIISAQVQRPTHGLYVDPANARVERNFTLDPHDPHPLTAAVPAGFTASARHGS